MILKKSYIFLKLLLIILALSFQFEFTVVKIDKIWSIGVPVVAILIIISINKFKKIVIPKIMIGFIVWLIWVTILALLWTPAWIGSPIRLKRIAYEIVYFLSLIFFFYCGYLVEKMSFGDFLFKWIARFTAMVSGISIFTELFGLVSLRKYLYMTGNERFGGFIQNPNDFAPVALIGLAYWMNAKKEPLYYRIPAVLAIVFSFIAGRSKGPVIITALYFAMCICNSYSRSKLFSAKKNAYYAMMLLVCTGVLGITVCVLLRDEISNIPLLSQNRIVNMVVDPQNLLNANGSDRMIAWNGAIVQILKSPVLGVGIGGSKTILTYLNYSAPEITPHNIYLELMAQCGVVLTIVIFSAFICFLLKVSKIKDDRVFGLQQAIILILLDGIFFASDWSSVPWIIFGILYYKGKYYLTGECSNKAIGVNID